jgi:hypothetical protein
MAGELGRVQNPRPNHDQYFDAAHPHGPAKHANRRGSRSQDRPM